MNKKWDNLDKTCACNKPVKVDIPMNSQQAWHLDWLTEAFRVLKPGGVIKAFGGTRTYHRLVAAMEQAGFVDIHINAWIFGSGFPKSLNISKALQRKKEAGADTVDEALIEKFEGYGTALKPAWEVIVVGRKPSKECD